MSSTDHDVRFVRSRLNDILDFGRRVYFSEVEEEKSRAPKKSWLGRRDAALNQYERDQTRLQNIAEAFWFRFVFLMNASFSRSPGMEQMSVVLSALMEGRQALYDIMPIVAGKRWNIKNGKTPERFGSLVQDQIQWLVTTVTGLEELIGEIRLKIAQRRGHNAVIPVSELDSHTEAPIILLEERLAFYKDEEKQPLFIQYPEIKNLRLQLKNQPGLDTYVQTLVVAENLGKALTGLRTVLLAPGKALDESDDYASLFADAVHGAFAVARGNVWTLLKRVHGIDLTETSQASPAVNSSSPAAAASGATSSAPEAPAAAAAAAASAPAASAPAPKAPSKEPVSETFDTTPPTEDVGSIVETGLTLSMFTELGAKISVHQFIENSVLYWCTPGSRDKRSENCLPLAQLAEIWHRKQATVFQRGVGKDAPEDRCFSFVSSSGLQLSFEATSARHKDRWLYCVHQVLKTKGFHVTFETTPHNKNRRVSVKRGDFESLLPLTSSSASPGMDAIGEEGEEEDEKDSVEEDASHVVPGSSAAAAPGGNDQAWTEMKTSEGFYYYYNSVTQESTWTRPACLGPDPRAQQWEAYHQQQAAAAAATETASTSDGNKASAGRSSIISVQTMGKSCAFSDCSEMRIAGKPYCREHLG